MNDPGQSYTETQVMNTDRNVYVALFMDFLPLLGLAFTILMLKGLKAVKASYMGETFMARFANIIITSSIGALLAVGCAAVLPEPTKPRWRASWSLWLSAACASSTGLFLNIWEYILSTARSSRPPRVSGLRSPRASGRKP